ncbi:MAG: peroxidase family protein [Candidatus Melainabacteria bacterium]|mgnify:CR=1 FL=1|nr:peroxidase family protein [Candidatus Melainabacteria bacterium]
MNDSPKDDAASKRSGCPVNHGASAGAQGDGGTTGSISSATGAGEKRCPYTRAKNALSDIWRPQSKREGIGPIKYVYWNAFYYVLQAINRGLSRDPYNKVSWDKWPSSLGLLYLLAKIRFNRSNALTDPYDYATNDSKDFGPPKQEWKDSIDPSGIGVSDDENPQMGAKDTRFGSNIPPKRVRPDVENMEPSAREAGKLRWRRLDPESGKEITQYAGILNNLAGGWIQFQFHGFGGNTKRDAIGVCPHMMKREPHDNWPGGVAKIDRTSADTTRITDNGRPTVINERVQAWIQGEIYGTSEEELNPLRAFKGGKMLVENDGSLPEDPKKPGIDLTGFSNNYNPLLSFLHWLFVSEHNAIADYYASFHPEWSDERLFQMARRVNIAQMARIHTIQWTEDLLQHPTLQIGMHADWYGFLGQRGKMYLMRLSHRYPWVNRLLTPLRNSDVLSGMPGSSWEHHDGPFQVPKHFRLVYRLHEMILGETDICEPGTDRLLDRISLIDFVHHNTRGHVANFGKDVLAWSFVRQSAGHLKLHNVPRQMTQFENQQDGTLTDICERDIFRERTDGTGTYNEFRLSVGEPPVTSFMELTGGDAELAREIEIKYNGDIDTVDAGIGILAEPKPAGFALGYTQFYQFVLNAPRRVKSNRHLTQLFNYDYYMEGMNWVEHGGGMGGAMYRHLPKLRPLMEGVTRFFAPWKDAETFPARVLETTHTNTANVFKSDLKTLALGAVTAVAAVCGGAVSMTTAVLLLVSITIIPTLLTVKRMLAMRFLQLCWKKCYTDKRFFMFGTLERAEQSMDSAAHFGCAHALAVTGVSFVMAAMFCSTHPIVAALLVLVGIAGLRTRKWSNQFAANAQVLKIALRNRMREGTPETDPATLTGDTDIERRYWFLRGDNKSPIASFKTCYHGLRDSGLPAWKALGSTIVSMITFGRKTRKGLTRSLKKEVGFGIYLPHLIHAKGYSSTRIYAPLDNTKGITPGDIDMEEFDLMFRLYAPGRDHLTAYDFARMREGNARRDADEGRGTWFSRLTGRMAAGRRATQLLMLFADRVVEEDKKLVPAISRDMLLRFYNGAAQADLYREHTEGDRDPSPTPRRD